MTERVCIYGPKHDKGYDKELQTLENWPTSTRNKHLMQLWHNHLFALGAGQYRVTKLSAQIRKIALHLGKDLDTVQKGDIEALVAKFNREESWAEATKADYRRCIKQFYKWYEEEDPRMEAGDLDARKLYKYITKHIVQSYKVTEYDYSEVIKDEEVQKVLQYGCKKIRDKAFISVLHEAGFRAGEMLTLRLRDVEFKENRVIIKVDGKTGMRRVPLVKSIGYLARWLDDHPFKDNQQSFLWTGDNRLKKYHHKPLKHGGAQKLIRKVFAEAGVERKNNMHWFRHSRATLNAPHMTEVIMCKFFGWVIGSKQVRRYVHSNVVQVEDAVLGMHGIKKPEDEKPTVEQCVCGMMNDVGARYCHKCGKPLNVAVVMEDDEKKKMATEEAFELLQKILDDSDLKKKFDQFKKTSGTI